MMDEDPTHIESTNHAAGQHFTYILATAPVILQSGSKPNK
jgi:hypothetical protein